MDADKARELVQTGAAILLLDVPPGTRVGLDHMSFVTAENFKGWKMVPPGPHYLTYNAASRSGEFAPTVAVLCFLASKQLMIRRWSPTVELILPLRDEDEAVRLEEGFRRFDFDCSLAPYNLPTYQHWQAITGFVGRATVSRIAPVESNASITAETDPSSLRPPTAAEARLDAHLAAGREQGVHSEAVSISTSVGRCRYLQLPRLCKTAGMSASQLTARNLDKSALLRSVIAHQFGGCWQQLLAEFEVAFVTFLYGQSLEGFAQWKDILIVVMGCEEAAVGNLHEFFVAMLHVLQAQLSTGMAGHRPTSQSSAEGPASAVGALIEELLPTTFLRKAVSGFIDALADVRLPVDLANAIASLKAVLGRLGFRVDVSELDGGTDDEDGPVVVEL